MLYTLCFNWKDEEGKKRSIFSFFKYSNVNGLPPSGRVWMLRIENKTSYCSLYFLSLLYLRRFTKRLWEIIPFSKYFPLCKDSSECCGIQCHWQCNKCKKGPLIHYLQFMSIFPLPHTCSSILQKQLCERHKYLYMSEIIKCIKYTSCT